MCVYLFSPTSALVHDQLLGLLNLEQWAGPLPPRLECGVREVRVGSCILPLTLLTVPPGAAVVGVPTAL